MTSDPDKQKHAQAPHTETNRLTSLATAGELFNDTQIHKNMAIGTTTRHVISKGKNTTEVVYKTHVSNSKGRPF
jgi:hypothetical protein